MPGTLYVYEAVYDYVPAPAEVGFVALRQSDIVEITPSGFLNLNHVTDHGKPEGWLKGTNKRTEQCGFIPGNHLIFKRVLVDPHSFEECYSITPEFCSKCTDYIWGYETMMLRCKECALSFHRSCSEAADPCTYDKCGVNTNIEYFRQPIPIEQWSQGDVIKWLAVVNLSRYVDVFHSMQYSLDGQLLARLDVATLEQLKVRDPAHRVVMMKCIDELLGRPVQYEEGDFNMEIDDDWESESADHMLSEHSFADLTLCHKCKKYLYGILRQGLQCKVCGLCLHRQCGIGCLPECGAEYRELRTRGNFVTDPWYGYSLEGKVRCSILPLVPDLLYVCAFMLEQRHCTFRESYRKAAQACDIVELKKTFDTTEDAWSIDLSNVTPSVIGGTVKKYFKELSNPLVPMDEYMKFIEVNGDKSQIAELIRNLPAAHREPLEFTTNHLCRLCSNSPEPQQQHHMAVVFSQIFFRPEWSNIMDIIQNRDSQRNLIIQLYELYYPDCNKQMVPVAVSANPERTLADCPWFWDTITREEEHEKMMGQPDGTFLVRKGRTHSSTGEYYTIALRKGGQSIYIKVVKDGDKYGFRPPCHFNSVQEIIEYFSNTSLKEYNSAVDISLRHPITKDQNDRMSAAEQQESLRRLKDLEVGSRRKTEKLDKLIEDKDKVEAGLNRLKPAFDSFTQLIKQFQEHLRLNENNQLKVEQSGVKYNQVVDNARKIQKRLEIFQNKQQEVAKGIEEQEDRKRDLLSRIHQLKPELRSLNEEITALINKLMKNDVTKDEIDEVLGTSQPSLDEDLPEYMEADRALPAPVEDGPYVELPCLPRRATPQNFNTLPHNPRPTQGHPQPRAVHTLPVHLHQPPQLGPTYNYRAYQDQTTWLVDCNRPEAVEKLRKAGKSSTFLVRPKGTGYALSILYRKEVYHCLIVKRKNHVTNSEEFLFERSEFVYQTIEHLVEYYRDHSLSQHNPALDTTLKYPVNA